MLIFEVWKSDCQCKIIAKNYGFSLHPTFQQENIIAREIIMSQKSKWLSRYLDSMDPWRGGFRALPVRKAPGEALMFQAVGGDGWLVLPSLDTAEGSRARGGVAESRVSTESNRWSQEVHEFQWGFQTLVPLGEIVNEWRVFRRGPGVGKRDGLALLSGTVFADPIEVSV